MSAPYKVHRINLGRTLADDCAAFEKLLNEMRQKGAELDSWNYCDAGNSGWYIVVVFREKLERESAGQGRK